MVNRITDRISRKYASALFEACDVGEYSHVEEELRNLVSLFKQQDAVVEFLGSKTVGLTEKLDVISLIAQKLGLALKVTNLVKILAENGRISGLTSILTYFTAYVSQFNKLLSISVCSATEIAADERHEIEQRFKDVVHPLSSTTFAVDAKLIGGLIIRSGDRVLDFSVKGQLDQLKKQMSLA